ncbi:MAG TPA: hypothetical protein VFB58_15765 [Chloroflexota bacterium]|nr:hypothetical protein [Chloroflexota bacterium]
MENDNGDHSAILEQAQAVMARSAASWWTLSVRLDVTLQGLDGDFDEYSFRLHAVRHPIRVRLDLEAQGDDADSSFPATFVTGGRTQWSWDGEELDLERIGPPWVGKIGQEMWAVSGMDLEPYDRENRGRSRTYPLGAQVLVCPAGYYQNFRLLSGREGDVGGRPAIVVLAERTPGRPLFLSSIATPDANRAEIAIDRELGILLGVWGYRDEQLIAWRTLTDVTLNEPLDERLYLPPTLEEYFLSGAYKRRP